MSEIRFVVDGRPVGKGRPRFTRTGHTYTPVPTRNFEAHVRMMAQLAMAGRAPLEGAVVLTVTAFIGIPKSWSRKKTQAALEGMLRPITRPDFDNYAKIVADSCNTIVWRDDSQVVDGRVIKFYDDDPRLEVFVEPLPAFGDSP